MGVMVQNSAGVGKEIAARCGQTLSTCANLRSKVFKSKVLDTDVKLTLVRSLLHTRLFYNSELWTFFTLKEERKLQHAYITTFRAALGLFNRDDSSVRTTDTEILARVKLLNAIACSH